MTALRNLISVSKIIRFTDTHKKIRASFSRLLYVTSCEAGRASVVT